MKVKCGKTAMGVQRRIPGLIVDGTGNTGTGYSPYPLPVKVAFFPGGK